MKTTEKRLSFRLLLFAGLFLFTPIFAMVDVLPDAIGYLLFVLFLAKLSDLNDEIAASKQLFSYLFVLSLMRELLTILVHSAGKWENAFENPTLLLLLSFVWGLLQALFLVPAMRHFYRGFSALSESYEGNTLWTTKRNLTLCERAERKTTILVLLHSIFVVLPEFGALGLRQGQSTDEGLYGFINTYRLLAGAVLVVLLILWLLLWIGFYRALRKDPGFEARLQEAKEADLLSHPGRAARRTLYRSLFLLGLSMLVFLPIRMGDLSIFPGALYGILALIGLLKLSPKKWIASLPLILVGLTRIVLHFLYLQEHLPKDALYETEAYYGYLAVRLTHMAEFLAAIALLIVFYRFLCGLVKARVCVVYEGGDYSDEASLHATKKLQDSLCKKLRSGFLCFLASGCFALADLILRPGFAFFWIPASLFGALGLFVFWLPAFRDATDDFVTLKV